MHEPMRQHRCTRGHQVWLIISVSLGLALGTQAAAAKECQRETPLPADVQLIAPTPEVPEAFTKFAGVWTGEWEDSGGLCHTLVVEEVLANGFARVTLSAGTSVSLGIPLPGFFRVTGRIVDGILRFHDQGPDHPEFTYRVTGETLSGTY